MASSLICGSAWPARLVIAVETLVAAGVCGWLATPASALAAGPPSIQFDVQPLIECRDVTTAEFRALNPHERLIEARLTVSVLAPPDSRMDLSELLVRCENPDRTASIVDFAPRTALATDVSGVVKVQKEEEENRSLDYHLKANYPGVADADLQGSNKSRMHSSTNFERLPPRELCVASGTINRGCGVYFKWKPTSQTTLEGARELSAVFRVAGGWRADWLAVHCEAFDRDGGGVNGFGEGPRSVRRSFVVALYEAGDVEARQAAIEVLRAEAELRRALVVQRREVQKTFQPQPFKEISHLFKGRSEVPDADRWWNQVAYGPAWRDERVGGGLASGTIEQAVTHRLPGPVRDAVRRYELARRELRSPRQENVRL